MVPTGARTLFRRLLVHHRLGARRIDDALGEAVHLLDLGARAVGGRGSLQGGMLLGHDAAAHLGGERVQPVIGLRDGAAQRGNAVADQHDRIGVLDEARDTAHVGLDVDMGGHEMHRLAQHEGRIERQHVELMRRAGTQQRDDGVVVHVDGGADVGPQAQDLAAEIMADAGHALAPHDAAGRHVGDDDVLELHLLERDLGMLGVSEPVWEIRMRDAHHHVAQGVVDVAAACDQAGIFDELAADGGIEGDWCRHGVVSSRRRGVYQTMVAAVSFATPAAAPSPA
jgi:hypothetical protein